MYFLLIISKQLQLACFGINALHCFFVVMAVEFKAYKVAFLFDARNSRCS